MPKPSPALSAVSTASSATRERRVSFALGQAARGKLDSLQEVHSDASDDSTARRGIIPDFEQDDDMSDGAPAPAVAGLDVLAVARTFGLELADLDLSALPASHGAHSKSQQITPGSAGRARRPRAASAASLVDFD